MVSRHQARRSGRHPLAVVGLQRHQSRFIIGGNRGELFEVRVPGVDLGKVQLRQFGHCDFLRAVLQQGQHPVRVEPYAAQRPSATVAVNQRARLIAIAAGRLPHDAAQPTCGHRDLPCPDLARFRGGPPG